MADFIDTQIEDGLKPLPQRQILAQRSQRRVHKNVTEVLDPRDDIAASVRAKLWCAVPPAGVKMDHRGPGLAALAGILGNFARGPWHIRISVTHLVFIDTRFYDEFFHELTLSFQARKTQKLARFIRRRDLAAG